VRQVKIVRSQLVLALPKGRKTRDIPLPATVANELARHIAVFPPLEITLPWEKPGGEPTTVPLLLYSRERKALDRHYFNTYLWKPALATAGIQASRANGMHALRHFYASVLLDAGESIKALSEYSGTATRASPDGPTPTCYQTASNERGRPSTVPSQEARDGRRPDHGPGAELTCISAGQRLMSLDVVVEVELKLAV
jgi:hypothetical protein